MGYADDLGFSYAERKNGDVVISRDGKAVTRLRGPAASKFIHMIARLGVQKAMARATGNYRRGNERHQKPF